MTVLFLGSEASPVLAHLQRLDEGVVTTSEPITPGTIQRYGPDFLVSHGYRHILKGDVLELVSDRAINLHISYLPWNRGADPNLWSWIEDTPKGVTIHYIDTGVDTGDVIAQREVRFDAGETLASSYARLQHEMLTLFQEQWPRIRRANCARRPQHGPGTMHRTADKERVAHLLSDGWQTPVAKLTRVQEESRESAR